MSGEVVYRVGEVRELGLPRLRDLEDDFSTADRT